MDFAPREKQPALDEETPLEITETNEVSRKLAMLALICAMTIEDDCSSGPNYPNIPFGD